MSGKETIVLTTVVMLAMLFVGLLMYKSGTTTVQLQVRDYAVQEEKAFYDSKTGKLVWIDEKLKHIFDGIDKE